MAFGLENKKVALVGLDKDLSDAYLPFLQRRGVELVEILPGMVPAPELLKNDAAIVHLTHNEQDINYWVENLLLAHKSGLYMLVLQYDMYDTDVQPRITLRNADVQLRSTSKYKATFHELIDHLKMVDLQSDG
jgi:hypothetical protein